MQQIIKKQAHNLKNVKIPVDFPITKCPVNIAKGAKDTVTTYTREDVRKERVQYRNNLKAEQEEVTDEL